jgi:hypothetical protein
MTLLHESEDFCFLGFLASAFGDSRVMTYHTDRYQEDEPDDATEVYLPNWSAARRRAKQMEENAKRIREMEEDYQDEKEYGMRVSDDSNNG